jgi:hypothetical protein
MTLSRLASDIADRVIHAHCEHGAKLALADSLLEALGFHRADKRRRIRRPNWRTRDRFLAPYEKQFGKMVKGVWDEERRVILANMRKYPWKGATRKDNLSPIDNWLYPSTRFTAKLSKGAQAVLASLLDASITEVIAEGSYDVVFDVVNEHALDWLRDYTPKLSENLEAVNTEDLTRTLREGLEAGESMDDLKRRVNEVFDEYDSVRAERIARSEAIRSSEEGNLAVYREAGFSRKVWFANPDACELCGELDNVDVPLEEPYFDDDYGDGMAPPRHPNCRCASAPFESEWAD